MLSAATVRPQDLQIAIVDDEPVILETLTAYFKDAGFKVFSAESAEGLRRLLAHNTVDLVLLDIRLPDENGLSLMRDIRAHSEIPVILVTSKAEETDRVVGLELGADDYVTKPFSPRELLARVQTVLRRTLPRPETEKARGVRRFAGWILSVEDRRLSSPTGETVRLTHAEYDLLAALVLHPGRIMSRNDLIDAVGDREWNPNDRTIDVLISRLRRKIEADPGKPRLIVTEYGLGYVFAERVT
ncbi:response regulator [Azospirillum sp. ST 5-10]|uniref:response regulator n=1 Tax=unclassified Azospirillum TaxID=2630922 RepID=UPI003F4A1420